jgi:hypothetical protein
VGASGLTAPRRQEGGGGPVDGRQPGVNLVDGGRIKVAQQQPGGRFQLERVQVVDSPNATHLRFKVIR